MGKGKWISTFDHCKLYNFCNGKYALCPRVKIGEPVNPQAYVHVEKARQLSAQRSNHRDNIAFPQQYRQNWIDAFAWEIMFLLVKNKRLL